MGKSTKKENSDNEMKDRKFLYIVGDIIIRFQLATQMI